MVKLKIKTNTLLINNGIIGYLSQRKLAVLRLHRIVKVVVGLSITKILQLRRIQNITYQRSTPSELGTYLIANP